MSDLGKIGTSMLNMDDIASYLRLAKGFLDGNDTAQDTKKVAGVLANYIATAYIKEYDEAGNPVVERDTVNNAMNLAGHPATYYLTSEGGASLVTEQNKIKKGYNEEIANLRDELEQLKLELVKNGSINKYTPYNGFYDCFRSNTVLYEKDYVGLPIDTDSSQPQRALHVDDSLFETIMVGDHLYLEDMNSSLTAVMQVSAKGADHETIYFATATGFDMQQNMVRIYKSKGIVQNGRFLFGEQPSLAINESSTMYTGLNDDTYHTFRPINKDYPGYAYSFRIPVAMQKNYLKKIDIAVKAVGNPGALKCYIIDEAQIVNFQSLEQAKEDNLIVAESQPLTVDASKGQCIVSFNFYNDSVRKISNENGYTNSECYPYLSLQDDEQGRKIRYVMIVAAVNPDELDDSNYVNLEFLTSSSTGNADLQLNNTTYYFNGKDMTDALTSNKTINATDLYYGITLLKAVENKFTPFNEGMYTAKFEQQTPFNSSKFRVTMRVNREGIFHVNENLGTGSSGDQQDGCTIEVVSESNAYVGNGFNNSIGRKIIVGNNISTVEAVNDNLITLREGFYLNYKDCVYPVSYNITVKASYDVWEEVFDDDNNSLGKTIVRKYTDKYSVPLIAVMPDKFKSDTRLSDRLIFEADLADENGNFKPYNKFEFEIYWNKSCKDNSIVETDGTDESYPFMGTIKDLTVTIDNAM